jgi:HD superfamily phosphohydrolase
MLPKYEHEIRDPIHTFIRVSSDERRVIDSRAFQRLRHIHQLALTFSFIRARRTAASSTASA